MDLFTGTLTIPTSLVLIYSVLTFGVLGYFLVPSTISVIREVFGKEKPRFSMQLYVFEKDHQIFVGGDIELSDLGAEKTLTVSNDLIKLLCEKYEITQTEEWVARKDN